MPGLVRKLLIVAAVDGLILQPPSGQRAVKIRYEDNAIVPVNKDASTDSATGGKSFEAFGIVGMSDTALDLEMMRGAIQECT